MQRHNAVKVLEALLMGIEVETDGRVLVMDEDERLCMKGIRMRRSQEDEEVMLLLDMSLDAFVAMCDRMNADEVTKVVMNVVLNKTRGR